MIMFLFIIQCALFAFGCYQIMTGSNVGKAVGIFNVLLNGVCGAMNALRILGGA